MHAVEKLVLSSYLLGMIHADEERPGKEINATDAEIPPIKFEEAVEFLKRKVPIKKKKFSELEDKLKFRAFTVAKLGTIKAIKTVKEQLIATVEDGKGYAEFWNRIKQTVEDDPTKIKPGYWETVFRTNTQSAYMAGKLEQFQNDKSVVAYQLLVIEDSRTTQICRNLLKKSTSYGMILPKSHSFWKTYGFAPYHMNCRTSIRAVFKSQVGKPGNIVENPTMKSLKSFKPQKGFGGNPLDTGNWWKLTESQIEQAIEYGILGQFNREENVFAVYDDVWDGYKRKSYKSGGWYDLCDNPPDDWFTDNKRIVEFLAENGYHIKVIPDIQNIQDKYTVKWSNPDILLNGKLADIKTVSTSIKSRLKSAKNQKLKNVVLFIPDNFSLEDIYSTFENWSHGRLNITWIYKNKIYNTNLK